MSTLPAPPPPPPLPPVPQGAYPYGVPGPVAPTNGMAVASLVLGILGVAFGLTFVLFFVAFPLAVLAIIFGALGRGQRYVDRKGLATAGLVLGSIGLLLSIVVPIVVVAVADEVVEDTYEINSDPADGICDASRFLQDPDC